MMMDIALTRKNAFPHRMHMGREERLGHVRKSLNSVKTLLDIRRHQVSKMASIWVSLTCQLIRVYCIYLAYSRAE